MMDADASSYCVFLSGQKYSFINPEHLPQQN